MRITLDTNCLIDLEQQSNPGEFLRELLEAHNAQRIRICVVAISASERTKGGKYASNFNEFQDKMKAIGLGSAEILLPLGYWDIAYWDHFIWGDGDTLEPKIHAVLFQEIPFLSQDYCTATGVDINDLSTDRKWRNAKCDVLALWSHIHHGADVFVTSDANFHKATKQQRLIELGAKNICTPEQTALMVRTMTLPSNNRLQGEGP